MRTAAAPFRAFGVGMGSHLARPLDGNGFGGPE
jgi:hypothetical protein